MLNFRGVNVVFLFSVGFNLKVHPAGKHSKDDIKGVGDFGSTIPKKLPPLKGKQFSLCIQQLEPVLYKVFFGGPRFPNGDRFTTWVSRSQRALRNDIFPLLCTHTIGP